MATGRLAPVARQRVLTDLGVVAPGALLHTYVGGTPSTPLATFSDDALTVQNANPVVASAGGLLPPVYLTPGLSYRFLLTDAGGSTIWDQDSILIPDQATVANGGTGAVTLTAHGVLIGNGTSAVNVTAAGTAGQVLTSNGGSADPTFQTNALDPSVNDFRLTLTTAVPVTTADVLAATTLYCSPLKGNRIGLYDGSMWNLRTSAEFSIAVPATTGQLYDVFCFDNAGVPTLELLAWTNDTTRATALVRQDGVLSKTGAVTRRYLGSMRTTAVSGQTEDSAVKRYLWNYANRVDRALEKFEATGSWTYNTNTVRQANAAAANQVEVVIGVSEEPIILEVLATVTQATSTNNAAVGVGLDSTTTFAADQSVPVANLLAGVSASLRSLYRGLPGIGRHVLSWNEVAFTNATTTFWGTSAAVGTIALAISSKSGLLGTVRG